MGFAKDFSDEKLGVLYFNKKDIDTIDKKSIVTYQNSFYNFVFRNFTANDFDFFISILCILREKGKVFVDLDYRYLLKLILCKKSFSKKEFFAEFKKFADKAMNVYFLNKSLNNDNLTYYSIFSKIELNEKQGNIVFLLDNEFLKLLNNFKNGFYTSFFLEEFLNLKSKYSKMFFILLSQFLYKGSFYIDLKDFYFYLSLNVNTYDISKALNLDNRILIPSIQELQTMPKFKNLSCKKIKKDENNPKSKVIALYFTF